MLQLRAQVNNSRGAVSNPPSGFLIYAYMNFNYLAALILYRLQINIWDKKTVSIYNLSCFQVSLTWTSAGHRVI